MVNVLFYLFLFTPHSIFPSKYLLVWFQSYFLTTFCSYEDNANQHSRLSPLLILKIPHLNVGPMFPTPFLCVAPLVLHSSTWRHRVFHHLLRASTFLPHLQAAENEELVLPMGQVAWRWPDPLVFLWLFCLEASKLHTGLPTLWPEGDSMELAKRNKMEAGKPEWGNQKSWMPRNEAHCLKSLWNWWEG